jgi:hypothetical protein
VLRIHTLHTLLCTTTGIGRCGREQRWRAQRLVALEKLDIHARDLLSRDAASAHSALQSLESVEEALRNAVPADHVATIMGWTTTSTSSTAGTDSSAESSSGVTCHLDADQQEELHRARSEREALFYYSTLKQPAQAGSNALLLGSMALCNDLPSEKSSHSGEALLPDWLTVDGRVALQERAAQSSADCAGLCEIGRDKSPYLAWQSVHSSLSAGARHVQCDSRLCVTGAGFDVISTGESIYILARLVIVLV